jgi:glycosyltransferase involved in cell wall biosynthesis
MKLLFVTPEYLPDNGGGIITFYRFVLPELVRQGHTVDVVVADGRHIGEAERSIAGVRVRYLDRATHGRWLERFARYAVVFPWLQENLALAWAAWETAREGEGYDHVETTDWPLMFVPWVLQRDRVPCTVQLHGSHGQIALGADAGKTALGDSWVRLIEGALLKEALAVQTNSHLNGQLWEQRLGRPVSVEHPAFQLAPEISRGKGTLSRPLTGRVFGRFNAGKGVFPLAEALSGEAGKAVTIEWFGNDTTYGASTIMSELRSRFPAATDRALRHFPQISHDEVLAKMTDGAFVLIPTLSDVFNLTLAEAMAMRALVVCSKYAGASELIEDGVNGYRYDPLDAGSLAGVLTRLAALSSEQVEAMAECGARTVAEKLDPARSVERRAKFYAQVAVLPKPSPVSAWLGEALSGSPQAAEPGGMLDRCGFSELTAAILRRAPWRTKG